MPRIKHIVSCQHPHWVRNKYTHERILVSCGKCDACYNKRHMRYVNMMETENVHHKYAMFCTLNYSDKYVPKLYRVCNGLFLQDPDTGFSIPVTDSLLDKESMVWYRQKSYFEYSRFSDFQKFMKRFRQRFKRSIKKLGLNDDTSLRYFCSAEMGPFTIRPHFHFLLFFNSGWLQRNFSELFYKSWSVYNRSTREYDCIGIRSQFRPCNIGEDSYTAAYCDGYSELPGLFRDSSLRPKQSFSRRPSLGCCSYDRKEVSQLLYRGALRCYNGIDKEGVPVVVQVPKSVENRIFPKTPEFSVQSDSVRMESYRIYEHLVRKKIGLVTYNDFKNWCINNYTELCRKFPSLGSYLERQESLDRPFYQLYYSSKFFYKNRMEQNLSCSQYFSMIKDYYKLKDYYHLRDFAEFAESYSEKYDANDLYCTYSYFSPNVLPRQIPKLYDLDDYRVVCLDSSKIHKDGVKSKKERDYQLRGNAVEYTPDINYSVEEDYFRDFNNLKV